MGNELNECTLVRCDVQGWATQECTGWVSNRRSSGQRQKVRWDNRGDVAAQVTCRRRLGTRGSRSSHGALFATLLGGDNRPAQLALFVPFPLHPSPHRFPSASTAAAVQLCTHCRCCPPSAHTAHCRCCPLLHTLPLLFPPFCTPSRPHQRTFQGFQPSQLTISWMWSMYSCDWEQRGWSTSGCWPGDESRKR